MLLGIKWYQYVWNDEVRQATKQPHVSAIVLLQHLSLFGHTARMPDKARRILTASLPDDWRPPGRPHVTWFKTIQQEQKSKNLSLNETIDMAQNPQFSRDCCQRLALTVVHA